MTVVVWDGTSLATDRAASDGGAQWESVKAWQHGDVIISGVGPLANILAMRDWYIEGASTAFPACQGTPQWAHLIVATRAGLIRYEQSPIAIPHGHTYCAFGEGRDFALGALAMGADAAEAVEVANKHSPHCGLGVEVYTP